MRARNMLVAIVVSTLQVDAWACVPRGPEASYAQEASYVGLGRVVEAHRVGIEWLVLVEVSEVLKGKADAKLEAITQCALPLRLGVKVVVVRIGDSLVAHPADLYEKPFRAATGVHR